MLDRRSFNQFLGLGALLASTGIAGANSMIHAAELKLPLYDLPQKARTGIIAWQKQLQEMLSNHPKRNKLIANITIPGTMVESRDAHVICAYVNGSGQLVHIRFKDGEYAYVIKSD